MASAAIGGVQLRLDCARHAQCVLTSDRPTRLCVNHKKGQLHAESAVAALRFSDGLEIHARSGIVLPDHYGCQIEDEWCSQWVTSERDRSIQRLLIEGIGYSRLCEELQATILDQDEDYQLVHLDRPTVHEALTVLKENFSQGQALRVAKGLTTIAVALAWVDEQQLQNERHFGTSDWWSCSYRNAVDRPLISVFHPAADAVAFSHSDRSPQA